MARYLVILIVVCSMFSLNAEAYGAYTLVKDVFSGEGAGAISASASYKLQGTLGQNPEPGIPRSTNYVIYEGFWSAEGMGVPPVFVKDISDKIIYINEQCGSDVYYIPFEVTDDKTAVAELIVEKSSSNQQLIPDDNIKILDNKQIQITLLNRINAGYATITLTAKDADDSFASESFKLTVEHSLGCEPPVFVDIPDKIIYVNANCGSGVYYIPFEVTDDKTAVAEIIVKKESSNHALIPDDKIAILDNKQIKITLSSKTNNVNATITLTATDADGLASSESFNVIVNDFRLFFNLQRAVSFLNELQNNAADSVELKHVILILQVLVGKQPGIDLCIDLP